jgi:hypothetical protein
METKYDVIGDNNEKVKEWVSAGRKVSVWHNLDLSSRGIGSYCFTPGDQENKPGWRYGFVETVEGDRLRVFSRLNVVKRFTETAAGYRAACRLIEKIEGEILEVTKESPVPSFTASGQTAFAHVDIKGISVRPAYSWLAPIGIVHQRFTVEQVDYFSATKLDIDMGEYKRPLDSRACWTVVSWSCIEKDGGENDNVSV